MTFAELFSTLPQHTQVRMYAHTQLSGAQWHISLHAANKG